MIEKITEKGCFKSPHTLLTCRSNYGNKEINKTLWKFKTTDHAGVSILSLLLVIYKGSMVPTNTASKVFAHDTMLTTTEIMIQHYSNEAKQVFVWNYTGSAKLLYATASKEAKIVTCNICRSIQ